MGVAWFDGVWLDGYDDTIAIAKLCCAVKVRFEAAESVEAVVPCLGNLFLRD